MTPVELVGIFVKISLIENKEDYKTLVIWTGKKPNIRVYCANEYVLHGIEKDFPDCALGTHKSPKPFEADGLKTFDCVVPNHFH
jgi:type I restriction enzyme M protein